MKHIIYMVFLGVLSGMISAFWTRIISKNMIFQRFGKCLDKIDNHSWIMKSHSSPWVRFVVCSFCITPYIVFLLEAWYVIEFTPYWMYCLIGITGGLGAGNFVAEVVHILRNE